jgi:hypothetical protein
MLILTDACYYPLVTSRSFRELSGIDIPPSTPWAFYLLVLTNILNSAEISCEMWALHNMCFGIPSWLLQRRDSGKPRLSKYIIDKTVELNKEFWRISY